MNRSTVGIVVAGMLVGLGCERTEPNRTTSPSGSTTPTTPTPTTPAPSPRTDSGASDPMHDQQAARWRIQLDDVKIKVDSLRAKSAMAPDATKAQFQSAVSGLSDQIDMIQSRLNDLKGSTTINWDAARIDIDSMFTRLNSTLRDVQDKYAGMPNSPPTPPPATPPAPTPTTPPATPPSPTPEPSTPPTEPGPGPG